MSYSKELESFIDFIEHNFFEPHLNMNDALYFACADLEEVYDKELIKVYELYNEFGNAGILAWVALARQINDNDFVPESLLESSDGERKLYLDAFNKIKSNRKEYFNDTMRDVVNSYEDKKTVRDMCWTDCRFTRHDGTTYLSKDGNIYKGSEPKIENRLTHRDMYSFGHQVAYNIVRLKPKDEVPQYNKRKWCYCQKPITYSISGCTKCQGTNTTWSDLEKHCFCYDCELDYIPEHAGIFDGPIPLEISNMLGLSFDIIDLETNKLVGFDTEEYHALKRK